MNRRKLSQAARRLKTRSLVAIVAPIFAMLMSACGSNDSSVPPLSSPAVGGTVCTVVNGQQVCTQMAIGGCIPINTPISFSGSNIVLTSSGLEAGIIPGAGSFGTIGIGTGTTIAGYGGYGTYTGYGDSSGTVVSVSVSGAGNIGSIVGTLQLSALMQQTATLDYDETYGAYGVNGAYGTTTVPCISGLAMYGYFLSSVSGLSNGMVYMYFNGTQNGYSFPIY